MVDFVSHRNTLMAFIAILSPWMKIGIKGYAVAFNLNGAKMSNQGYHNYWTGYYLHRYRMCESFNLNNLQLSVFPNPTQEILAVQVGNLVSTTLNITFSDLNGRVLAIVNTARQYDCLFWYSNLLQWNLYSYYFQWAQKLQKLTLVK